MPDWDYSGTWYHGSQQELARLRSGSSITQSRDVAKAFSHRPSILSMSGESLKHDGATPGYLHVVAEAIAPVRRKQEERGEESFADGSA